MLRQLGGTLPQHEGPVARAGRNARYRRRSAPEQAVESLSPVEALNAPEPVSRFQPGALRPVADPAGTGKQARRERKAWRLFDRVLLAAEVASALVVAWLAAQYIYTAYIDTTPRHLTPRRPVPASQGAARQTPRPTATPTLTFTPAGASSYAPPLAAASAPLEPGLLGDDSAGDIQNSRKDGTSALPGSDAAMATDTFTPTLTPTITPTATPTVDPALLLPVRLRIPVMFLDSPVHEVTVNMGTWEVSALDVGHHEGSGNPGETGNVVLAAHRDINSALFRDLDRLKPGDEVFVSNSLREYKYIVNDSFVVSPSHTEVMDPTDDKRLTLITCTPIGLATQRLIVTAILDEAPGQ